MTLAQQRPVFSLLHPAEVEYPGKWQQTGVLLWPKRLWWHLSAYTPILGILVLVLGSVVFLQLHWFIRSHSR